MYRVPPRNPAKFLTLRFCGLSFLDRSCCYLEKMKYMFENLSKMIVMSRVHCHSFIQCIGSPNYDLVVFSHDLWSNWSSSHHDLWCTPCIRTKYGVIAYQKAGVLPNGRLWSQSQFLQKYRAENHSTSASHSPTPKKDA